MTDGGRTDGGRTDGGRTDGGVPPQGREPHERVLVEMPVTAVGRGSSGPLLVALLVLAAFAAGLLRPWDVLVPPEPSAPTVQASVPVAVASAAGTPAPAASPPTSAGPTATFADPATVLCGYPATWRTMSRVWLSGRPATVWVAAQLVAAVGPGDPTIPVAYVGEAPVTAIGWCAPVGDEGRPPSDAAATLFSVNPRNGNAQPVAYTLLAPLPGVAGPMAQLWGTPGTRIEPWPGGRYVIRFATPSGTWVRFLGLDVAGLDDAPQAPGSPLG